MSPVDTSGAKEKLKRFCEAQVSRAYLLISDGEVMCAKEKLPEDFVPFMVVEEKSWPDVYAFDSSSKPASIVVWSDHAVVERWDSFEDFLRWIRSSSTQRSA